MTKIETQKILISFLVLFLLTSARFAKIHQKNNPKKAKSVQNITGSPSATQFNINNISTWIYNNGNSDLNPNGRSGFTYPKGSNKTAVFKSGLIWGATVNGEKKVGGSTYISGLLPGKIIGNGATAIREDKKLEHVRIYRVRRNLNDGFTSEITDKEGSVKEVITQYEKDWNEWPAEYGAPYEDIDNNGNYNPDIDIPGVPGANQTIWYVANDLDESTCKALYGSTPMGIEMQVTIWGYNSGKEISNTMLKKYKLINKSSNSFDSMFVSMWADPDIGDAADDFVGCDTTLSLMYSYNANATDYIYDDTPPAVGFDFVQGPIVPSSGDTAIVDGKQKPNYKNLEMCVHYFFISGDIAYQDVPFNEPGALRFHHIFRGEIPTTGAPFTDPNTGKITKFTLAGNPVTKDGWIDGQLYGPGDRRQGMVAGPFTMAPGDTQEVVVAELVGGGTSGISNLDAITTLKENDKAVQKLHDNFFNFEKAPLPKKTTASFIENGADVTLTWTQSSEIENFNNDGYKFQGYNIFQIGDDGKSLLIRTFDIIDGVTKISQLEYDVNSQSELMKTIQFGTDSGIKHRLKITKDYINDSKLLKGRSYYFAVVAYTYTLDNSKKIRTTNGLTELIELNYRGSEEGLKYGDLIEIKHISGSAEKDKIIASVFDESQITKLKYNINFFKDTLRSRILWKLTNENGVVVLDSMSQMTLESSSIIVDGLMLRVNNIPKGIKDWSYNGPRWISGTSWGGGWLFGGMDMGYNFFGSTIKDGTEFMDVQLKWAGVTDRSDESATALATKSKLENPKRWSKGTSYARDSGYVAIKGADIPFAAYDMGTTPPRRLNICIVEDANSGTRNLLWDMGWDGSAFAENGGREYIFIMASDYNEGINYDDTNFGEFSDVLYAIWPKNRGVNPYLAGEFIFDIIANSPYSENDVFEFKSDEVTAILNSGKLPTEYSLSQNYPNPFNPSTTIKYSIHVSSNKKISNTKLVVYDILGREVATLVNKAQKAGNYEINFNASNLSSGVYIYRLQSGNFVKSAKMLLLK